MAMRKSSQGFRENHRRNLPRITQRRRAATKSKSRLRARARQPPRARISLTMTRRYFFGLCSLGIGTAALATLLAENGYASMLPQVGEGNPGLPGVPHFAPKAKRVIYLFQSGAPSQLELFDHKPQLEKYRG